MEIYNYNRYNPRLNISQQVLTTPPPSNYVECSREGGTCNNVPHTSEVYYGANTPQGPRYTKKFVHGISTPCNNNIFGDPAPGQTKFCHRLQPITTPLPPGYTQCSAETGTCTNITPGTDVYYGTVTPDGPRYLKKAVSGTSIPCNFSTFGGDPAVGYSKHCYRAPGAPGTPGTTPPFQIQPIAGYPVGGNPVGGYPIGVNPIVEQPIRRPFAQCSCPRGMQPAYGTNGTFQTQAF